MEQKTKTQAKDTANKKKTPPAGRCEEPPHTRCEECEFYDYDEDMDAYVCQVSLDEDEMISFVSGHTSRCPYFRYYDEYKSVHKQI